MAGKRRSPASAAPLARLSRRSLLTASAAGAGGLFLCAPAIVKAQGLSRRRSLVVGAGVFGAWTAEYLRRQGDDVVLIDSLGPAHARASSGGESRMTRAAYGKDSIYTRMATDSLAEWKALSARTAIPLFHPHGVLFFTGAFDSYFTESLRVHRELGLPIAQLDRAAMAARFPMIDFEGVEAGLWEAAFGALMARRAVQTLVAGFVAAGGTYERAATRPPASIGPRLAEIATSGGPRQADRFVFAAGPWLPALFPDLLGGRITPTRQEVFFFAPPAGDRRFLPGAMPGWADFNAGDIYYGFPDLENRGVKFAHDAHGPVVDPDTQSRAPTREALDRVIAFRDRRFPALRNAPLTEARVCQYENSSNGDFLIDRHPDWRNVVLVGGGSGHGFKHGPEVGRRAAALLDNAEPPEPRFALASKDRVRARAVH